MPRPYSDDLRERAAALVASGRSCRETAALFGVSVARACHLLAEAYPAFRR